MRKIGISIQKIQMTYEELIRKYVSLFILVIEVAGDTTNNKYYRDVALYVERNENLIQTLIDREVGFPQFISTIISVVLLQIHDDSICGYENTKKANELIEDLYIRYLRTPTNKFMKENGLKPIRSLIEVGHSTLLKQK